MLKKKVCFKTVKAHLVSHADTPLRMCFSQFTVVISERWNQLCTAALFSFPTLPAASTGTTGILPKVACGTWHYPTDGAPDPGMQDTRPSPRQTTSTRRR